MISKTLCFSSEEDEYGLATICSYSRLETRIGQLTIRSQSPIKSKRRAESNCFRFLPICRLCCWDARLFFGDTVVFCENLRPFYTKFECAELSGEKARHIASLYTYLGGFSKYTGLLCRNLGRVWKSKSWLWRYRALLRRCRARLTSIGESMWRVLERSRLSLGEHCASVLLSLPTVCVWRGGHLVSVIKWLHLCVWVYVQSLGVHPAFGLLSVPTVRVMRGRARGGHNLASVVTLTCVCVCACVRVWVRAWEDVGVRVYACVVVCTISRRT